MPALQETPAPVRTMILVYFLEASILAMVLMEAGTCCSREDVGCLGAIETPSRVAVRASMLTSSCSFLGDDADSSLVAELLLLLLIVHDSLFSTASKEPLLGVST